MNVKPREKSCRAIREVAEDTEVLNSPGEGVAIFDTDNVGGCLLNVSLDLPDMVKIQHKRELIFICKST